MEPLTQEQIVWARQRMSKWLRVRAAHAERDWLSQPHFEAALPREDHARVVLTQLAADVDHSALLWRLLEGKEPLVDPPPLDHGYPVYPD
jgi:hypothetical protein